jgi:PAS domain S-box-containing protein
MEKTLRELTEELIERDSKIAESEKMFRTAFCVNPLPMTLTSLDGTFIKVNKAVCALMGMREEDLLGHRPTDFDMYVDGEQRNRIVSILESGQKINKMPVQYRTRTGTIDTLLSAAVVKIDGVPYILAIFMV